jgi:multiple sugar transport system permease protein
MLKNNRSVLFMFLAPAVLCYLGVFLYPTLRTVVMSFFAVENISTPAGEWRFNFPGNYLKLFGIQIFVQSLRNILRIWLAGGLGVMALALLFAVILTQDLGGKKFFRAVIYLPNVVSAVAMGTMWLNFVYNPDYGFLHTIFSGLGFQGLAGVRWTAPGILGWSMLGAYCFGMVGYHMLIFISGIEQIPTDYFDAALIEGANIFQRFFHITLPNLRGVMRTNVVMWTVFTVGFFVWGQLFSPVNLSNDTAAPMNVMYELVFGSSSSAGAVQDTGAGAAIGVILMLMVVAVFFITNALTRRDDGEL